MISIAFTFNKTAPAIIEPQQMLEAISKSFVTHTGFLVDNSVLLLIFIVFCLIIAVLYWLTRKPNTNSYFIKQPAIFVKKLLNYTMEHKSIFDVQIEAQTRFPSIEMQIVKLTDAVIVLRSLKKDILMNATDLAGSSIRCTLLVESTMTQGYYVFTSKVAKEKRINDYLEVALHIPDTVEKLQRREHLRIHPKPEHILGIALWSEQYNGGVFVNKVSLWGKPTYKFVPGKTAQIKLVNLSASGARMIISTGSMSSRLDLDKKTILLLDLWDADLEQKLRYWVRCTEQNSFKIRDKNAIEIGVRFTQWTTSPLHDDSLHFVLVSKDKEIPPLADWIMKRYLEQYKEDIIPHRLPAQKRR